MPVYNIGDVLEVVFRYGSVADPASQFINRCHFVVSSVGPGGVLDEATTATDLSGMFGAIIKQVMSDQYSYNGLLIQGWPGGIRSAGHESSNGFGVGARTGIPASPQTAVVVKKRTVFAGRKYRGRIFIPGISGADAPSGILGPLYRGVVNGSGLIGFMTAPNTVNAPGAIQMIVATENGALLPTNNGNVFSAQLDPFTRSQRRRQVGRGS